MNFTSSVWGNPLLFGDKVGTTIVVEHNGPGTSIKITLKSLFSYLYVLISRDWFGWVLKEEVDSRINDILYNV